MAQLLKGTSADILQENIRALRHEGYSEEEAVRRATMQSEGDDAPESDESVAGGSNAAGRRFVVVTKDFSGLGWAKKLQEEGEEVVVAVKYDEEDDLKLRKMMKEVGEGWIDVVDLDDAVKRYRGDDVYWIFAENCFVDRAVELIDAGQKVFPPSIDLAEKMEHDRQFAIDLAKDAGLDSMPSHEFSSQDEGLAFLDKNPTKAYVLKPNDGKFNYLTFVPVRKKDPDANREVYEYLAHMKEDCGSFVLQERISLEESLEVNCELWLYEGEPLIAWIGLEVKRKNTYDLGEMSGCAGDFTQQIPIDSKLVRETVGKLLPFYKEQKYTGFADVNVIFAGDGKPYFLEVCNRFGYNAHPNMFLALAKDGFGNVIADYVDGRVEDFASRFRTDVGCSLTMFLDHPRPGLPVHVEDETAEQFYPFDGYVEDDQLLLTGYSDEIGIFLGRGKDIPAAWKAVSEAIAFDEAVSVPDMYYRWDLAETNYYNSPVLRMKQLKQKGLL